MAEIHRMSLIYKNVTAVISAATACDASDDFLRQDRSALAQEDYVAATAGGGWVTPGWSVSRP